MSTESQPGRPRWTRRLARLAFVVLAVLAAAAGVERLLEARAYERLTRTETFAQVGRARIRYHRTSVDRPGPTVLFVNGMAGELDQWDAIQARVSEWAPTLAYDRGGWGFSTEPRGFSAADQAEDLRGLLDVLGVKGPLVVVGYSNAVEIVEVLAAREPGRVKSVLLIEPNLPEIEGKGPTGHGPFRLYAYNFANSSLTTLVGFRRFRDALREWRGDGPRDPSDARAREVLVRFPCWWALVREWLLTRESQRQGREAGRLAGVPVVIVSGDPWGTGALGAVLDAAYRAYSERTPGGGLRKAPGRVHDALDSEATSTFVASIVSELVTRAR